MPEQLQPTEIIEAARIFDETSRFWEMQGTDYGRERSQEINEFKDRLLQRVLESPETS